MNTTGNSIISWFAMRVCFSHVASKSRTAVG
jgi:hypothetical protein